MSNGLSPITDTVPYGAFLREVMPYVQDVAEFVAENAIRNAVIEFCDKTLYIQHDLDPITSMVNVANYELDVPHGTRFVDVVQGYYNGVLLIPKSIDELVSIYRNVDFRQLAGNPAYITRVVEPIIQLVPYPIVSLTSTLALRIALSPLRDSEECPSRIYEHYVELIGYGARARLYNTVGQTYYDPKSAQEMQRLFLDGIGNARRKAERSLGRGSQRVQFIGYV